ncbi:MAG TPA: EamA family transporter [Bryobacteraceae bacterium]|nr:EamA family transporter [Bryobacteraceae bacterium]
MRNHPQFKGYLALACVCVFWGTTYLGIRVALESFSPISLMGIRYTISGGLLLIAARVMGVHLPRGRELWQTAMFGVFALGIGTGTLTWAELTIPSGLAALFCTTSPFWMVGIESLMPEGEPLHAPTILGMLVGLSGVVFLVTRTAISEHGATSQLIVAFCLLQASLGAWSLGSILQRKQPSRAHPFVSGAIQQFATGVVFLLATLVFHARVAWTPRGIGAIAYLAMFGGIIGYSAFVYSMANLPIAIASLYNYVNPLVAVALGWLFYREPFGVRECIAMVLIFLGVGIVKRQQSIAVQELRAERAAESGEYGE